MYQHEGAGGGCAPRARRLSILARDSLNANSDALKRLSNSFQQARLSNNPAQVGSISFAPTPVNVRGNFVGPPARKGINSSLPRSNLPIRSGQKQSVQGSSAVRSAAKYGASSNVRNTYQSSALRESSRIAQPPRSAAHPAVSALKKSGGASLRRSASIDASQWGGVMNNFVTPTPGKSSRSRSKSPMSVSMRRWGSSNDVGMTGGGSKIKIPCGRDKGAKTVLQQMSVIIINFMMSKCYQVTKDPNELISKLSTKEYYKMVQFAAHFLVGPQFLQDADLCTKIVELSMKLKYGGTLTKSHLKSITGNAVPSCLGFLCWLCARASAVEFRMEHLNNPSPLAELHKDGWVQFSRENLLEIFYCERSSWNLSSDDKQTRLVRTIEAQLQLFEARFYETYMSESEYGLQQLEHIKNEKMEELAKIKAKPNPAREACVALEAAKQKLSDVIKRTDECKSKITTYKEMHSLRSKMNSVKSDIQSKLLEIQTLKTNVSNQPIDKQGERKLLSEIEVFRKERGCLQTMLDKLNVELEKKRQVKANLDDKLRHFMTQFTIVETCNTSLLNLGLSNYAIPANPMSAEELTSWLEMADERLESARIAIESTIKRIQQSQHEIEVKDRRVSNEIKDLKKELETLKISVQNNASNISVTEDEAERRLKIHEDRYQEMCKKLSVDKRLHDEVTREVEELKAKIVSLDQEYQKQCDAIEKWEDFLDDHEMKAQQMRTEVMIKYAERHRALADEYEEYLDVKRRVIEFNEITRRKE